MECWGGGRGDRGSIGEEGGEVGRSIRRGDDCITGVIQCSRVMWACTHNTCHPPPPTHTQFESLHLSLYILHAVPDLHWICDLLLHNSQHSWRNRSCTPTLCHGSPLDCREEGEGGGQCTNRGHSTRPVCAGRLPKQHACESYRSSERQHCQFFTHPCSHHSKAIVSRQYVEGGEEALLLCQTSKRQEW